MKTILALLFILLNSSGTFIKQDSSVNQREILLQTVDLKLVRNDYKTAATDNTRLPSFNKLLSRVTKKDRVELIAYKGAGIALKGKYAKKIKEKRDFFIEGVSLVEYAITKAPENIELRFIRIGIQENTPKLLKYKANIEADKAFILANYNTIKEKDLKNHIVAYIQQSTVFTAQEKQKNAQ